MFRCLRANNVIGWLALRHRLGKQAFVKDRPPSEGPPLFLKL